MQHLDFYGHSSFSSARRIDRIGDVDSATAATEFVGGQRPSIRSAARTDYALFSAKRPKRFERMKKVGAQSPTKIPNRSAWALVSGSVPPVRNQIAMEPKIETKPRLKQTLPRRARFLFSISLSLRRLRRSGCRPARLFPSGRQMGSGKVNHCSPYTGAFQSFGNFP